MATLPNTFIGSISEGTLLTRDLLGRFINVLAQAEPEHRAVLEYNSAWQAATVLADLIGCNAEDVLERVGYWDAEPTSYLLNEYVFDALNEVAPAGTYFSSSEGDGASFGFWPIDHDEDDEDMSAADAETYAQSYEQHNAAHARPWYETQGDDPDFGEGTEFEVVEMPDEGERDPRYLQSINDAKAGLTVSAAPLPYHGLEIQRPCVFCGTVDVHFQGKCNSGLCQHPDCKAKGLSYTSQYNHYLHTPTDHVWTPATYLPRLITRVLPAFEAIVNAASILGQPSHFTSDLFRDYERLSGTGVWAGIDSPEQFMWLVRDTGTDIITAMTERALAEAYFERTDALPFVWDQTYLPGIGLAQISRADAKERLESWRRGEVQA